jgi:hypothetical protein
MNRILPILFSASLLAQGAEPLTTKEKLDGQFREKIVALYHSDDLAHTAIDQLDLRIMNLARSIYSPHPDILKESAKNAFLALPTIKLDDLPPGKNPFVLPIAELLKSDPKNATNGFQSFLASERGGSVFLNCRDAVSASKMAMQMAVTESHTDSQMVGKRVMLTGYVRDVFHRINDDFLHPKIAIESLGEWFVIDLDWNEIGFYFPSRIEWRRNA